MSNLILTRRVGETIVLNETITISFIEFVGQSQIGVAIQAPKDVNIRRGELKRRPDPQATSNTRNDTAQGAKTDGRRRA